MRVTNTTNQDYWFGPLHLAAGNGTFIDVDDTSATSLYLTDDTVADAINTLSASGKVTVSNLSTGVLFPRPTGTPQVLHGDGSPEGIVYAGQGSIYLRRDVSAGMQLYQKTTGIHLNTGWVALSSSQVLNYTEITADVTITATTEAGATTIITAPSFSTDGVTPILIEFFCPWMEISGSISGNDDDYYVGLFESGNTQGILGHWKRFANTSSSISDPVLVRRRLTPISGSKTYSIRGWKEETTLVAHAGSGGAGTHLPAYLRISTDN